MKRRLFSKDTDMFQWNSRHYQCEKRKAIGEYLNYNRYNSAIMQARKTTYKSVSFKTFYQKKKINAPKNTRELQRNLTI